MALFFRSFRALTFSDSFNRAPKASGIWGGVSVLHLLPPPTHPVAPSRPQCPNLLAPLNILGSLGSKQEDRAGPGAVLSQKRELY